MAMHGPDRSPEGRRPRRRADLGGSLEGLETRELMSSTLGAADLLDASPAIVSTTSAPPGQEAPPRGLDLEEMWTYRRWARNPKAPAGDLQAPTKPPANPAGSAAEPPKGEVPADPGQAPADGKAGEPVPAEAKPADPDAGKPVSPTSGQPDTGAISNSDTKSEQDPQPMTSAPKGASLLRPLQDLQVKEGTLISQNVSSLATDAPQGVQYSLVGTVPAGASIDANTGVISWIPKDGPSEHQLTVKAVAPNNQAETKSFKVTVLNEAPSVWLGPDLSLSPGTPLSKMITVSDPGDDAVTLTVDYGDGKPAQTVSLGMDRSYRLDHAYAGPGNYVVTVSARDDDGGSSQSKLTVRVAAQQPGTPTNPTTPGTPTNPGNGNPTAAAAPAQIKGVQFQPGRGRQRARITITFDKKISPNLAGFEVVDSQGQVIPVRMSTSNPRGSGTVVTLTPYSNKTSLTKNGPPQIRVLGDQLVDDSGMRVDANGDRIPGGTFAQVLNTSRRPVGRRFNI